MLTSSLDDIDGTPLGISGNETNSIYKPPPLLISPQDDCSFFGIDSESKSTELESAISDLCKFKYYSSVNESISNELSEFFSYTENIDFIEGRKQFEILFSEHIGETFNENVEYDASILSDMWTRTPTKDRKVFLRYCLLQLQNENIEHRLRYLDVLVYIAQGVGVECDSLSSQCFLCFRNGRLLNDCEALPALLKLLGNSVDIHINNCKHLPSTSTQQPSKRKTGFAAMLRPHTWGASKKKKTVKHQITSENIPHMSLKGIHDIPDTHDYWFSHKQLRQTLNVLFLLLLSNRGDPGFLQQWESLKVMSSNIRSNNDTKNKFHHNEYSNSKTKHSHHILPYLFSILSITSNSPPPPPHVCQFFPLKKILVLIRWHLILTLGSFDQNGDETPDSKNQHSKTKEKIPHASYLGPKHKSRIEDFDKITENCPRHFNSILFVDKSSRKTIFTKSGEQETELYESQINNSDVSDSNIGNSNPMFIPFGGSCRAYSECMTILKNSLHQPKRESNKRYFEPDIDVDILDEGSLTDHISYSSEEGIEQVYRLLVHNFSDNVRAILRLLLVSAPHVGYPPSRQHLIDLRHELLICPIHAFPCILTPAAIATDLRRHKEIILKNSSYIILALLKHFRRNHDLQFQTFRTSLLSCNASILILKILHHDLLHSLCYNSDVQNLSFLTKSMLYLDGSTILQLLESSKSIPSLSIRQVQSYINLMRIFQKIVKNTPLQSRILVSLRACTVFECILSIPNPEIYRYTLKIFKSLMPFTNEAWRKRHFFIITEIWNNLRLDIKDNWLLSFYDDEKNKILISLIEQYQDLLKQCSRFNSVHYQVLDSFQELSDEYIEEFEIDFSGIERDYILDAEAGLGLGLDQEFLDNYETWLENEVFIDSY